MLKYDFNPVGPIIGIRRDNNGMNKIDKENMKYLRSHVFYVSSNLDPKRKRPAKVYNVMKL